MFIDTHCHLNMIVKEQSKNPITENELIKASHIVAEAEHASVHRIITIGTNVLESRDCVELAQHLSNVYASIGIHPTDAAESWREDLNEIKKLLSGDKVVAIGECGLDFYWKPYHEQRQKDVFKAQIELALENNLALIIHTRNAFDETLKIVEPYKQSLTRVVMHCFSETMAAAQEVTALGFLLGITGTVTYPKNNELRNIVSKIGLNHIVLETDAPFLPPQIIRGKKNHPQYIAAIAHYLAQHLQVPLEDVAQKTTANAKQLFLL